MFWFILLALIVGFVLGHFIWTKSKIETIIKQVPVEKVVEKQPDDYEDYLKWKENKDDWINLSKLIPDVTIQDDVKFDKIMKVINKVLNETEGGELNVPKKKKTKKEHKEN